MVAMETKIKHFKCISYHAKISMGQKTLFSQKSKRGYKRLFFICFRQVSIEQIQTSIIHIRTFATQISKKNI
jgi:hypothetical protein